MQAYRPDRVTKIMTGMVSFVYYAAWVVTALLLVILPVLKKLRPELWVDPPLPVGAAVRLPGLGDIVVPQWGLEPLDVTLTMARGWVALPESQFPAGVPMAGYLELVTYMALALAFLHSLRGLFRRLRDGAPFDADNATRMRWVGVWLLAFHLFVGGSQYLMSRRIAENLASRGIGATPYLDINWFAVFGALVLVALAEIFRRGAELEEEQSLVV